MIFLGIISWKGASLCSGGVCFSDGRLHFKVGCLLHGTKVGFDGVSEKNCRMKGEPPPIPPPLSMGKPCSKFSLLFSCRVENLTSDCCHVNNLYKVFFLILSRYLIELLQMPWMFRGDMIPGQHQIFVESLTESSTV